MALSATQFTLLCVIGIILLARPAHAFGAGNIASASKIEGQNWRHGDLEDTLLTLVASRAMGGKKFSKLDVKRVYFGNWLRDYSQAIDVGTVSHVSAEAIRLLLWILGFMTFGYGTKEFEVTSERLGCYRPEEHIDNPKDYADNQDARRYDRRLRGPVNERKELAIDPVLGLKVYIASENLGIETSAGLIRRLFGRSIQLGRQYARNKNKDDLYEALRLLGTGCHCLEDFSAHSNYTELALIELGERDVFPHVGRSCQIHLQGAHHPVYPIITGTFGGVDFLHSVTGEFDDKVTQSEIQELEGTLEQAQNQGENTGFLQQILSKLPSGVFGGTDQAGKADELKVNAAQQQMANAQVSPRRPEEWLQYLKNAQQQIYPILEWHDEIMMSITETIEKIPILPDLIEQVQDQVNIFVFSLLAPFVLPIIKQIKTELNTGSSTIIQSSIEKQHIVFNDDRCSDPTHSMLSKDHFSNILNEPAGKVAGQVLKWAVPQLIACWDDERIDVNRTLNRIVRGVFHHPALRDFGDDGAADGRRLMFQVVRSWWQSKDEQEKDELRNQLSRDGVEEGRNHKPGVMDHGHGSAGKLAMARSLDGYGGSTSTGGSLLAGAAGAFGGSIGSVSGGGNDDFGRMASDAVGGGVLGDLMGGLTGVVGATMLSSGLGGDENTQTFNRTSYGHDGSRTQTVTQLGGSGGDYQQAQYIRHDDSHGGRTEEYTSYEQRHEGGNEYSGETRYEQRSSHGGFSSESRRFESTNISSWSSTQQEELTDGGGFGSRIQHGRREGDEYRPSHTRYGHESDRQDVRHGFGENYGRQERDEYSGNDSGRQEQTLSWGGRRTEEYGRSEQDEYSGRHARQDEFGTGGYERQDDSEYGSRRHGGEEYEQREEEPSHGHHDRHQSASHRRDEDEEYGQREEREEYQGEEEGEDESRRYGREW